MQRLLVAWLLGCALLANAGCGVVKDSARRAVARAFGPDAAALLGTAKDDPSGEDPAANPAQGGLSIAADESAAGEVADEEEGEEGGTGFYKIIEANGTVRFTSNLSEVPVAQRPKAERLAMAPSKTAAAPRARPALPKIELPFAKKEQPPAARARSGGHEVVLYTTTWCGWCKRTMAWLDEQGVDYVNKDVESDQAAASEMRELVGGDSGVPVVVIDGEVIRGFDQRRMETLLKI